MSEELSYSTMPWEHIEKITFTKSDHSIILHFKSGAMLDAKAPNEKEWDQMVKSAHLNLKNEQIVFE